MQQDLAEELPPRFYVVFLFLHAHIFVCGVVQRMGKGDPRFGHGWGLYQPLQFLEMFVRPDFTHRVFFPNFFSIFFMVAKLFLVCCAPSLTWAAVSFNFSRLGIHFCKDRCMGSLPHYLSAIPHCFQVGKCFVVSPDEWNKRATFS